MPAKCGNPAMPRAQFGRIVEHMSEDYNAPKKLARKELDYHLSKLEAVGGGKPFKNKVAEIGDFNDILQVYDWRRDAQVRTPPKRRPACGEIHDGKNFKPSHPAKHGYNKTLKPFPEYKENPLKFVKRKMPIEGEEDEMKPFKKTHNTKSRPTPSIQTNLRNLKAAFPSVFRK